MVREPAGLCVLSLSFHWLIPSVPFTAEGTTTHLTDKAQSLGVLLTSPRSQHTHCISRPCLSAFQGPAGPTGILPATSTVTSHQDDHTASSMASCSHLV